MKVHWLVIVALAGALSVGAAGQVPGPVYKEDSRFPLVGVFSGLNYPMMNGARDDAKVFVSWGGPNREWLTAWDLQTGGLKSQKHVLRMAERLQVPEISPSGKFFFQPSVDKTTGTTTITYLDSQTGQPGKTATFSLTNIALTKIPGSSQDERFLVGKHAHAGLLSGGKPQGWPQKGLPPFRGSPLLLPEDGRYGVTTDPMQTRLLLIDVDKFKIVLDMPLPPLGEYANRPLLADISADGRSLALRITDDVLGIIDVSAKKVVKELKGHGGEISQFRISRDGARAVSIGKDDTARFWDVKAGTELASHRTPWSSRMGLSQELVWIQDREGTVRTFTAAGAPVRRLRTQVSWRAVISQSGASMVDVVDRGAEASLAFWKLTPPALIAEHRLERAPEAVWLSPDGRHVMSRHGSDLWVFDVPEDKEVWAGKTAKGTALGLLPEAKGVVLFDGPNLRGIPFGATEPLWNHEFKSRGKGPRGFNFSGKYLSFAVDLPVVIDLTTGAKSSGLRFPASIPGLEEVLVSDDGRTIVTFQPEHREVSWWTSEGDLTKTCTLDPAVRILQGRRFSLSPDGSRAFLSVPDRILTITPDGSVSGYEPFIRDFSPFVSLFGEHALFQNGDWGVVLRSAPAKPR